MKKTFFLTFLGITLFCMLNASFSDDNMIKSKAKTDFLYNTIREQTELLDGRGIVDTTFNINTAVHDYINKTPTRNGIYRYKTDKGNIEFHALGGISLYSDTRSQSFIYKGLFIRANLLPNLTTNAYWWSGHFTGEDNDVRALPIIDSWYKKDSKIYLDNLAANINLTTQYGDLSLGRDRFQIGNSISGSIILQDNCNEYGYFNYSVQLGTIGLDFLHASLIPDSVNSVSNKLEEKYLSLHRVTWTPTPKISFFAGEEVIYASRGVDASYILPNTFMRISEHNLRNRDNVLIFAGSDWKITSNHEIYLNVLFDELSKGKIFTSWWGNKYAVQGGQSISVNLPFCCEPARIVTEATAVRPWIYTHNIQENKFSFDGRTLGYNYGTNLLSAAFEMDLPLRKNLSFSQYACGIRQGSVGNSGLLNYDSRTKDTADWLEGKKTNKLHLKSVLDWDITKYHSLKLALEDMIIRHSGFDKTVSIQWQTIY